jgi:hypothetical protein
MSDYKNHVTLAAVLKCKLTMNNWVVWSSHLKDGLNLYRDAGAEIRNNKPFDHPKPFKTTKVNEKVKNSDTGKFHVTSRDWNSNDDRVYAEALSAWQLREDHYHMDRAKLWTEIISSLDPLVHEQCRLRRSEYDKLQSAANTLGLYRMLYDIVLCKGAGDNFAGKVRQQWHSLSMVDKATNRITMKLADYILEFNGLLDILKDTDSNPNDAERFEQFLAGLHPTRYASFTQNLIANKTKTTCAELQDGVLRIENQLAAAGETSDYDPSVALAAQVTGVKRSADERQVLQLKAARDENSAGAPPSTTACQNCGRIGHAPSVCPEARATCTFCLRS